MTGKCPSRIKLHVKNKTAWQTRMLLPFLRRIAREEFDGSTPKRTRSHLYIDIIYNRAGKHRSYSSGYAYYNSSSSTIRVPFPHPGKVFPVLDFCHVTGHEFGHNRGLKHADMGWQHGDSCNRGSYSGTHYNWALALPVPLPRVAPKRPSLDEKRAKELKTAQAAVLNWQRKVKLANTKLKLWTRRVRTLEKRIAADAVVTPTVLLDRAAVGPVPSAPGTVDA